MLPARRHRETSRWISLGGGGSSTRIYHLLRIVLRLLGFFCIAELLSRLLFDYSVVSLLSGWSPAPASTINDDGTRLSSCSQAYYLESESMCYKGDFPCPPADGTPTLQCGQDCYLPGLASCSSGKLVYPTNLAISTSQISTSGTSTVFSSDSSTCTMSPITQHLSDPPYENYFYSDCHAASQVVVTSPLQDSDLTIIGPRLLVAWPAGNSGVVSFFEPQNGINGSLAIKLQNSTSSNFELLPAFAWPGSSSLSGLPFVGITTLLNFNSSAILSLTILGSIRTVRDFTEGPSLLHGELQQTIQWKETTSNGALVSRLWLDNTTTTQVSFLPVDGGAVAIEVNGQGNKTLLFEAGTYNLTAWFDYPQLKQLHATELLNAQAQGRAEDDENQTRSLSFLAYSQKILGGAWRFLTYFGRDSMIAALLLQPVLAVGEGSATEAVLSAVLERLHHVSGFVCHEETIGDYASYLKYQKKILGSDAVRSGCTYQMVDTQFYLAPLVDAYFLRTDVGKSRTKQFFAQQATSDFGNEGFTYEQLLLINAEAVIRMTKAFASPGGQTKQNLIHLLRNEIVGQWRDSTYGLGGGRIPYDVNTGLVPAALRSISALSAGGFFPEHPEWRTTAAAYAQVWEDNTLGFFEVNVSSTEAKSLIDEYVREGGFDASLKIPPVISDITFHGLALDGHNNQPIVRVMNTDDCFRLFLINTTNDEQLTPFIDQIASNIQAPFPVGLSNPVGLLVSNPAYGGDPVYAANWTNSAYHGTVIWSWQLAMMAAGLQRQLERCLSNTAPAFCSDKTVHSNVLAAYNHLWDLIEANKSYINNEVWSWTFHNGSFTFTPLGALSPAAGQSPTESNVRQLWSLTWLAVKRDESLR